MAVGETVATSANLVGGLVTPLAVTRVSQAEAVTVSRVPELHGRPPRRRRGHARLPLPRLALSHEWHGGERTRDARAVAVPHADRGERGRRLDGRVSRREGTRYFKI
jgi:hypothetical protein